MGRGVREGKYPRGARGKVGNIRKFSIDTNSFSPTITHHADPGSTLETRKPNATYPLRRPLADGLDDVTLAQTLLCHCGVQNLAENKRMCSSSLTLPTNWSGRMWCNHLIHTCVVHFSRYSREHIALTDKATVRVYDCDGGI